MSNDTKNYPEDSFDNMVKFAKANDFREMNYLIDETQAGPKEQIPSMGCNIKWFN